MTTDPHDRLAQALKQHIHVLAGDIGERNTEHPQALRAAGQYISDNWRAMGYQVTEQEYTAKGVNCRNLEITCPGTQSPDKTVLIGAHYDSFTGSPGANGNGSGVAALLEISHALKHLKPACTVRLVAFATEEPPLQGTEEMGSWVYAHAARARNDNIRCAIILDTIGCFNDTPGSQIYPPLLGMFYPKQGDFISMVSSVRALPTMYRFSKLFKQHAPVPCRRLTAPHFIPGIDWSDHGPFRVNGYNAFMITDTAPYRYPFYRSPRDTLEKVDYLRLAHVTYGITEAVVRY